MASAEASGLICSSVFESSLWTLSGVLVVPLGGHSIAVPGYMVWAALIYSVIGTWLTHKIGRPLVLLNFQQQRYEADFRFSLTLPPARPIRTAFAGAACLADGAFHPDPAIH